MPRKCEFDDHRYATDCGPMCPRCASVPSGHTLWIFTVYPAQSSYAQCVSCHHVELFMAPGEQDINGNPTRFPDIQEVKAAFIRALAKKEKDNA